MKCTVTNRVGVQCKNDAQLTSDICWTHASRVIKYGTVDADRPIREYTKTPRAPRQTVEGSNEVERFWNRIVVTSDHWIWDGTTTDTGTPIASWGKYMTTAARVMWEIKDGELPKGARVYRTCDHKRCVRPEHLEVRIEGISIPLVPELAAA
ncbi:HNH endonuclease [Streptomyces phage Nabi]|nr:HNH endonuclease [Streptomyces phage Nabi]